MTAPNRILFIISVLIALAALLIRWDVVPRLPIGAFWVMTAAYVVLAASCLIRGR